MRLTSANFGVVVVLLGALLFGFSIDRYPLFYVDEAFFAYPALKANLGSAFSYPVSAAAPFGSDLWAYHGPAFPHLLRILFHYFGFSTAISRLPNFIGAWLAILLLVVALKRNGYRFAGLSLALLWCGDRSTQEVMYGRMEGLTLLCLVCTFLCLGFKDSGALKLSSVMGGIFCGLAVLLNPLCVLFAVMSFLLLIYLRSFRHALWFAFGAAFNIPLLLFLWDFRVRAAITQFFWHAHRLQVNTAWQSFVLMLELLRWSRYWFVALLVFSGLSIVIGIRKLLTDRRRLDPGWREFLLATAYAMASLPMIFRASTHPYYIVYFAIWPMLCLVTLAERSWKQMRPLAVVMVLIWCSSAAWNALRVRETLLLHNALSRSFLYGEVDKVVPRDATVIVTPELYGVPLEATHSRFLLTTWFPEQQDACRSCYVLLTDEEFRNADYIRRSNLEQRTVLYVGPAFPKAGAMQYPVLFLSPESEEKTAIGSAKPPFQK
jgi:hypothetical protein